MLLAQFFGRAYNTPFDAITVIYTFLFHLSLCGAVYLNLLIWIPLFLKKKQYVRYAVSLIFTFIMAIGLYFFTFNHLADWLFPGYFFIAYYEWQDILGFVLAYVVLTTLLKLSKAWFKLSAQKQRLELLEKEKLQVELKALKSQINPHFLFNSLNNLYGLALDKDEKTPDLLLQLSQSMRYMLYESNEDLVALNREIDYLNNYLDLQKLRIDEDIANIQFRIIGQADGKKIAPLLFIPFVENAFKHGIKGAVAQVFIDMELKIKDDELVFKIKNNKGKIDENIPSQYKGIGLENVKRRLSLLYPNRHELNIKESPETFEVELVLLLL